MALPTRVQRGQSDPIEQVNREFEGFFNRMFNRDVEGGQFAPYGVDVREDSDHIYVEAELPGFRKVAERKGYYAAGEGQKSTALVMRLDLR